MLRDSFGRAIRDLRISITDRCNFRCFYCMPKEAMEWQPKGEILTYEEIVRLAEVFVALWESANSGSRAENRWSAVTSRN